MEKFAVCVYIRKGDRVLGVSRKDDPTDFGLPGGKVEDGESLKEAAKREAFEETGLEVSNLTPVFEMSDDGHGYRTVTFTCDYEGDIDSDEAGVVRWIQPETLFEGSFGYYNLALHNQLYDE